MNASPYRLKRIPSSDPSVDPEWQILRDDGTLTDIHIQDCRSYGGGFAVNRHAPETVHPSNYWVEFITTAPSLKAAFGIACKKLAQ